MSVFCPGLNNPSKCCRLLKTRPRQKTSALARVVIERGPLLTRMVWHNLVSPPPQGGGQPILTPVEYFSLFARPFSALPTFSPRWRGPVTCWSLLSKPGTARMLFTNWHSTKTWLQYFLDKHCSSPKYCFNWNQECVCRRTTIISTWSSFHRALKKTTRNQKPEFNFNV